MSFNPSLEELFEQGAFIVRALDVKEFKSDNCLDCKAFGQEIEYLNGKNQDGNYSNVDRNGQRGRSATLLVPDVTMELFNDVGLVYDADKSTIKAYMFHDSQTMSQLNKDDYFNIKDDKNKFEPILSRRDFINKYKEYREKLEDPNAWDSNDEYLNHVGLDPYNEVLGNFFPESLTGLVGQNYKASTLRKLLAVNHYLQSEHKISLPMCIMDKGKVKPFKPTPNTVAQILNSSKITVDNQARSNNIPNTELMANLANSMGYKLDIKDFNKKIQAKNISPIVNPEFVLSKIKKQAQTLLNTDKDDPDYDKIFSLGSYLSNEVISFEGKMNSGEQISEKELKNFQNKCIDKVEATDKEISQRSSWKPFLKNLASLFTLFGTVSAAASFGSRIKNGYYKFFGSTEHNHQDTLEDTYDAITCHK